MTRVSCRLASRWSLSIDGTLARHTASWRGHRGGSTRTSRHVYPWIARRWPGPSHARKMPLWCGTKVELQCTPSLLFHGQGDDHGSVTHASHDKRGDDTCSVHTLWHGVRRAVRQDDALIRVSTASHGVSSYRYLEVRLQPGRLGRQSGLPRQCERQAGALAASFPCSTKCSTKLNRVKMPLDGDHIVRSPGCKSLC